MRITWMEKIDITFYPNYVTVQYNNKTYELIVERLSYKDFIFFYKGGYGCDEEDRIPNKKDRDKIEEFLMAELLNQEWDHYKIKVK